jgi:hypothetical protein
MKDSDICLSCFSVIIGPVVCRKKTGAVHLVQSGTTIWKLQQNMFVR